MVYHQAMADETVPQRRPPKPPSLAKFRSAVVDRARQAGDVLDLPGGQILLPKVFGFCRGVERALEMLDGAVRAGRPQGQLILLGEIIHNPWVNHYFQSLGVKILTAAQREKLESYITTRDGAVIPAFGVPPAIQRRLEAIGCKIIDTTCGDVRRLWTWAERAAGEGHAVLIFGRALHDETVVTTSRLAAVGGTYLVAGSLQQVEQFCDLLTGKLSEERFSEFFGPEATNAGGFEAFHRLAQASQTTMLYDQTIRVRERLRQAFAQRFGQETWEDRLRFQPTVCRATQARQSAADEICRQNCDLAIVVGGFGSSNTRHLHELAGSCVPAFLIESAEAIHSPQQLETFDFQKEKPCWVHDWLPTCRPLRIAVLAGASSPEIVVGQVMEKLAQFLL